MRVGLSELRAIALAAMLAGVVAWARPGAPRIGRVEGQMVTAEFVTATFLNQAGTDLIVYGGPVDPIYFAPSITEVRRLVEFVQPDLAYTSDVYDCDDFSRHFKDVLAHEWAKEGHQAPLPIVEVYAALLPPGTDQPVYHAFNAIVTAEGKLIFIEPQGPVAFHFQKWKILAVLQYTI